MIKEARGKAMKFFFCSDTHGKPPSWSDADIILHGGDFYDQITRGSWPMFDESNDIKGMEKYRDRLVESGKKFYAVRGNHDVADPAKFFREADVTGKVVRISDGLFLVGLGWSGENFFEIPNPPLLSYYCAQLLEECSKVMKDGDQSVLISHYVASGYVEQQPGWVFDCVQAVAGALRPIIVLQGHCHRMFGERWEHDGVQFAVPGPRGMKFEIDGDFALKTLGFGA
jgi:Icc-related predicted phosphoesterase